MSQDGFSPTLPWGSGPADAGARRPSVLEVCVELARLAHGAATLDEALPQAAQLLQRHLQGSGVAVLRLHGWDGETVLIHPWSAQPGAGDLIDVTALGSARRDERPIGSAVGLQQVAYMDLEAAPGAAASAQWRPDGVRRVVVIPVFAHATPVAALELHDPRTDMPGTAQALDIARLQLAVVAQRESAQADMASRLAQLNRLERVAGRIAGGALITNQSGEIEWCNPALLQITGWPSGGVIGRHVCELLAADEVGHSTLARLGEQIAAGQPFRIEFEALRRGGQGAGQRYWGEVDAIPMQDAHAWHRQVVCLFTDITERKQRERQRELEREFLEALMENLPVSLFVMDPESLRLIAINRYAELEFGVRRSAVIGKTVQQAMGRRILHLVLPAMQEAIERDATVERELQWRSGGRQLTINARHFALRHADGTPRLLITLARDITAARRAQADLEESELRYRELVEAMEDGVYVTTPARDAYLYLGPLTEELWGVTEAEVRADPAALFRHVLEEDRPLVAAQQQREARFEPTDETLRIDHPRHGRRWLRHRTRTRLLPSGEARVYGLVSDVTAQREHALELQHARDLAEAASQAKSQFMANMSHEIRTPMNGILGMTELLLGTPLNDKQRRFAQAVYRSGESLLEIINDILDFAKIEAGKLELVPVDFTLRSVIEDTLELLAPRAHEKGLEISFREELGLPQVVRGDPLRLRQVITNLVANGIKFTESGEVVVDLRQIPAPPGSATPSLLEFTVRDTGIGIPADVLPKLFSAFTQANTGMARRYGGTGLGLAISKQLVELMGGQITAHSSPGVGSAFSFSLPLQPGSPEAAGVDAEAEGAAMPALRVLVADDNETNRTIIENMLHAWGMRVALAEDGRRALQMLQAPGADFDLALIDMQMPHLDGIGLAEAWRASGRLPELKLILLSSVSTPDDVRRAQEAGFQRFVSKPVRKAELRQAIIGVTPARGEVQQGLPRLQRSVLVVEDNPVNQEVIGHMLRRLGCQIVMAASALEGLRALCEKRFDAILMDIQMPGMDGVEALSLFRRGPNSRFAFVTPPDTPVIAVTANALDGDEERFLNLGFDDYLSKPFRQSQLLAVLSKRLKLTDDPVPAAASAGSSAGSFAGSPAPAAAPAVARVAPAQPAEPAVNPFTQAAASVLDADALERLRALDPTGSNHLMERVLKAFQTSVGRLLPMLQEAQQDNDLAGIGHVAHTLKSSSASIGAIKLSQLCAEIEQMIRRGEGHALGTRVDDLTREIGAVIQSLRSLLEHD